MSEGAGRDISLNSLQDNENNVLRFMTGNPVQVGSTSHIVMQLELPCTRPENNDKCPNAVELTQVQFKIRK